MDVCGLSGVVINGGVKYLRWEPLPRTSDGWILVNICQASLWGLVVSKFSVAI